MNEHDVYVDTGCFWITRAVSSGETFDPYLSKVLFALIGGKDNFRQRWVLRSWVSRWDQSLLGFGVVSSVLSLQSTDVYKFTPSKYMANRPQKVG